jgi:antitoxin component YwqK of YwqJK toxin-antitoxin module
MRFKSFLPKAVLFFSLLLSVPPSLFSQQNDKQFSQRSVFVTLPDKKISAKCMVRRLKSPKTGRIYYWFDNTAIHTTQGYYSGYLLDGEYAEYSYPGNALLVKGKFSRGLKTGTWLKWPSDGFLIEKTGWRKGKLRYRYTYDAKGRVLTSERYSSLGFLTGNTRNLNDSLNRNKKLSPPGESPKKTKP